MTTLETTAKLLYETYCREVGGKAFNGDPLPDWETFRSDPTKQKQSDAWMAVAKTAMTQAQRNQVGTHDVGAVISPATNVDMADAISTLLRSSCEYLSTLVELRQYGWCVYVDVPHYEWITIWAEREDSVNNSKYVTVQYCQEVRAESLHSFLLQALAAIRRAALHTCRVPLRVGSGAIDTLADKPEASIQAPKQAEQEPVMPAPAGVPSHPSGITDDPADPRIQPYRGPEEPGPQNEVYLVLSEEERAKGFVRPVRTSYVHANGKCNGLTTMGRALAETYARDPGFYAATYCGHCRRHCPVEEFLWDGTNEKVGS